MRAIGTILQPTWRLRDGRPVVQLFGRFDGPDGAPFLVEDDRARPSCFVPRAAVDRLRSLRGIEVRATALRDLAGREVVEV
ncbi:MAG TPA: hypothetical protein VIN04_05950, partial [Myxococcota bacterium]